MQYIVPERRNLFDMARIMSRDKLLHGSGMQPVLVSSTLPVRAEDIQPQGWTLKRPPREYSKIWVEVCGPQLGTLTKICDFPYPISDLTQNFIPYFRPDPYPISFG